MRRSFRGAWVPRLRDLWYPPPESEAGPLDHAIHEWREADAPLPDRPIEQSTVPSASGATCYLCASGQQVETHHVDFHHENDNPANLIPLCRSCHVTVHRDTGFMSFADFERVRETVRHRDPERFRDDRPGGQLRLDFDSPP